MQRVGASGDLVQRWRKHRLKDAIRSGGIKRRRKVIALECRLDAAAHPRNPLIDGAATNGADGMIHAFLADQHGDIGGGAGVYDQQRFAGVQTRLQLAQGHGRRPNQLSVLRKLGIDGRTCTGNLALHAFGLRIERRNLGEFGRSEEG